MGIIHYHVVHQMWLVPSCYRIGWCIPVGDVQLISFGSIWLHHLECHVHLVLIYAVWGMLLLKLVMLTTAMNVCVFELVFEVQPSHSVWWCDGATITFHVFYDIRDVNIDPHDDKKLSSEYVNLAKETVSEAQVLLSTRLLDIFNCYFNGNSSVVSSVSMEFR